MRNCHVRNVTAAKTITLRKLPSLDRAKAGKLATSCFARLYIARSSGSGVT